MQLPSDVRRFCFSWKGGAGAGRKKIKPGLRSITKKGRNYRNFYAVGGVNANSMQQPLESLQMLTSYLESFQNPFVKFRLFHRNQRVRSVRYYWNRDFFFRCLLVYDCVLCTPVCENRQDPSKSRQLKCLSCVSREKSRGTYGTFCAVFAFEARHLLGQNGTKRGAPSVLANFFEELLRSVFQEIVDHILSFTTFPVIT